MGTPARWSAFALSLALTFAAVGLGQSARSQAVAGDPALVIALVQQSKAEVAANIVDWSAFLPAGKGQIQVGAYCTTCHDLKPVVSDRRTDAEGWKGIVEDMVFSKGAPAPEDDIPVMAGYLAQYFSASTPKLELPVAINGAPKEILQLLPGFTEVEVKKLLEARKNGPIRDLGALEAIIGKERAGGVKKVISFSGGAMG